MTARLLTARQDVHYTPVRYRHSFVDIKLKIAAIYLFMYVFAGALLGNLQHMCNTTILPL